MPCSKPPTRLGIFRNGNGARVWYPRFPVFSSEWAEKPGLAWGHLQENMGVFYKCSLQFLQLDDSNPHASSFGVSILASPSAVERNRST